MRVRDVPLLVDVHEAQAEVGRQVDHAHPALVQRGHHRRGGAVRVGDDGGVGLPVALGVELLERQGHAVARVEVAQARADVRRGS